MVKRKLEHRNPSHMASNDPAELDSESTRFNHIPKLKKLYNIVKSPNTDKRLENAKNSSKMDLSISRKSTSDSDNNNTRGLNRTNSLRDENYYMKEHSDPSIRSSASFTGLNYEKNDYKADDQLLKISDFDSTLRDSIERYLSKNDIDSINNSQNLDDNLKDILTPSRKANYVHTLLSGRSSFDDSINILNKLNSQSEMNTQNSINDTQNNERFYDNELVKDYSENNVTFVDEEIETLFPNTQPEEYPDLTLNEATSREECEESEGEEVCSENPEGVELSTLDGETDIEKLISQYRRLHNSNMLNTNGELSGKLRVVVRCRPSKCANKVVECEKTCIKLHKPGNKNSVLKSQRPGVFEFNFDYIVQENETTEQLYTISCLDLMEKLFSGISVTVFAYGSTGSGKTYTITGTESSIGLIYLVMSDLFSFKKKKEEELYLSYFEVYNENVYDLLQENEINLQLQEQDSTVFVKGLTRVKITSYNDFKRLFSIGNCNRKVFSTNANRSSSRSHAILQVQTSLNSKLTIIDLAGSERMKITENQGDRLKESSYINQSLLALINCINTLSKNSNIMNRSSSMNGSNRNTPTYRDRVKYRDSKLTHLLKNSLSHNCFILMIAHVNPENKFYQDSYNTIKYALRAKDIEISNVISKTKCGKEVIKKFSKELLFLVNLMKKHMNKKQLKLMKQHISQSELIGQTILLKLLQ